MGAVCSVFRPAGGRLAAAGSSSRTGGASAQQTSSDPDPALDVLHIEPYKVCGEQVYERSTNVQVLNTTGTSFSPLSLLDLCVRALCRYDLPTEGLPTEVIDKLLALLSRHHAVRRDTLAQLSNCEMSSLSLKGCRGVDDAWLQPLAPSHDGGSGSCSSGGAAANITALELPNCRRLTSAAVTRLGPLPYLRTVNLRHCHSLDSAALCALAVYPLLTSLNAAHIRTLGDDALEALAQAAALRELDLEGCHAITDAGIAHISRLTNLRRLNLAQCHGLTQRGVDLLAPVAASALEELSLGWCRGLAPPQQRSPLPPPPAVPPPPQPQGVKLPPAPRLRALTLAATGLTDAGLAELCAAAPALTRLNLSQCSLLTDRGAAALADGLPGLTDLDVSRCARVARVAPPPPRLRALALGGGAAASADLAAMARDSDGHLCGVTALSVAGCARVDDGCARAVAALPALARLDARDTALTSAGLARVVSGCAGRSLRALDMCFCSIGNAGLAALSVAAAGLTELRLDSREATDAGVAHLSKLTGLRVLHLGSTSVSDDAIVGTISNLRALESLEVCSGRVTDRGAAALAPLARLRHLDLSQNAHVTSAAAPHIAALSNLTSLNLSRTSVARGAVPHLARLARLESLALFGCGVPRAPLCAALPALQALKA